MLRIKTNQVQPGDTLAQPIYDVDGRILLHKGIVLTNSYIKSLVKKGVSTLFIDDLNTIDIAPTPLITPEVRTHAVKSVYSTMKKLTVNNKVKDLVSPHELGDKYQTITKDIIDNLLSSKNLLVNLSDLFISKGYFFHHSVNVATIAGIIGIAKGYSPQKLVDLGVGALLFDIGMTQVPGELWSKKGNLTIEEKELIENHTKIGFEILRKQRNLSLLSAHCALQHHERYDGSGYPRQLKKDEIHEFSKIVGIADVYDALTSSRTHRKQYTPQEAAEFLSASGDVLFDYELVKLFLKYIAIYPIASTVLLNNHYTAVVSKINSEVPLRPVVRLIKDPYGKVIKSPYEIDLCKELTLTITKVL